jgi:type IV secretory pathway TrbD component
MHMTAARALALLAGILAIGLALVIDLWIASGR